MIKDKLETIIIDKVLLTEISFNMDDNRLIDYVRFPINLTDYLKENNVEYIEYNISKDEEARRNLIKLGYMSVPVTLINGNHVLGFDKLRIRQLLNGKE